MEEKEEEESVRVQRLLTPQTYSWAHPLPQNNKFALLDIGYTRSFGAFRKPTLIIYVTVSRYLEVRRMIRKWACHFKSSCK